MSTFMQPEITQRQRWLEIDGPEGTEWIPSEFIKDASIGGFKGPKQTTFMECEEYVQFLFNQAADYRRNRKAYSVKFREGFGARYQAPGYLDCTDWCVFDKRDEAVKYLLDEYLESEPEAKVTFSAKLHNSDIEGDVINPGDWFGKTWLVVLGGIASFVVEADNAQDAVEELAESEEYGQSLRLAEPDIADYNQDEIQYTGSGIPYDNADVTVIGDEGKKQPFKCTYHVEGFDEDISPLLFAS